MQQWDDNELLEQYVERHSEKAFAILVQRHINKVYSVAKRHVDNAHRAEEITQAVFVILARKSPKLIKHQSLAGWLYQTARTTALTMLRSEIRRSRREQEAYLQSQVDQMQSEAWQQMAPVLDNAIEALCPKDREAIVLRFFDGKSMREVSAALALSEEAAKKRVGRAVDKLRLYFSRRGIVFPASVICGAISTGSVQAAPAGLAATVAAVAAKESAAAASTSVLVNEALQLMAWAKAKTAAAVGAGVLLTAASATIAVQQIAPDFAFPWQSENSVHSNSLVTDYGKHTFNDGAVLIEVSDAAPAQLSFLVTFQTETGDTSASESLVITNSAKADAFPVLEDRWAFCVSETNDVWLFDGDSRLTRLRNTPDGVKTSASGSDPALTGQAPVALKQWITKKKA